MTDYVRDLRSNSYDASTMGSIAMWYDSYARKIDQLPVVGVDPEVLAYSRRTANAMRRQAALSRARTIKRECTGERRATICDQHLGHDLRLFLRMVWRRRPRRQLRHVHDARYGAENDAKTTIRREETANAGLSSQQIMQQIEEDTASTRQRMSLKYKENF